jgi:hypothetical protein
VLAGSPFQLLKLEQTEAGQVWKGPYPVQNVLTEGIAPSGMAVAFNRLWLVSGGDPRMMSIPLHNMKSIWSRIPKVKGGA